jgi:hypothetical protein
VTDAATVVILEIEARSYRMKAEARAANNPEIGTAAEYTSVQFFVPTVAAKLLDHRDLAARQGRGSAATSVGVQPAPDNRR